MSNTNNTSDTNTPDTCEELLQSILLELQRNSIKTSEYKVLLASILSVLGGKYDINSDTVVNI